MSLNSGASQPENEMSYDQGRVQIGGEYGLGELCSNELKVTDLANRFCRVKPGPTLLTSSSQDIRANEANWAESAIWDATNNHLLCNRALRVLNHHNITTTDEITLPDGSWVAFADLPAIGQSVSQQHPSQAHTTTQGQQQLKAARSLPPPRPIISPALTTWQISADKWS
eukprot:1182839-Rhodomonas_salina.1